MFRYIFAFSLLLLSLNIINADDETADGPDLKSYGHKPRGYGKPKPSKPKPSDGYDGYGHDSDYGKPKPSKPKPSDGYDGYGHDSDYGKPKPSKPKPSDGYGHDSDYGKPKPSKPSDYGGDGYGIYGKPKPSTCQIRQNFAPETEAAINQQINLELTAYYIYKNFAYFFDRDDVALHGFFKYFIHRMNSKNHAGNHFIGFLNLRCGRWNPTNIPAPIKSYPPEDSSALAILEEALAIEKTTNEGYILIHKTAKDANDGQTTGWLEKHFLTEQVEIIKALGDMITNLRRVGQGLGLYMFNHITMHQHHHHPHHHHHHHRT